MAEREPQSKRTSARKILAQHLQWLSWRRNAYALSTYSPATPRPCQRALKLCERTNARESELDETALMRNSGAMRLTFSYLRLALPTMLALAAATLTACGHGVHDNWSVI